jgi:hypothetical protein
MKQCNEDAYTSPVLRVKPGDTVKQKRTGQYWLIVEQPLRAFGCPAPGIFMFNLDTGLHRHIPALKRSFWEKVTCCFKECEGELSC